jgi:hypothetical protein
MAFIDIFNFKKYFLKPSDSQVARYGHVNALYEDLKLTKASYVTTPSGGTLNVTTDAGVVSFDDDITSGASLTVYLANPNILSTSVILATITCSNALVLEIYSFVENGGTEITVINNTEGDAENVKINFLIIN